MYTTYEQRPQKDIHTRSTMCHTTLQHYIRKTAPLQLCCQRGTAPRLTSFHSDCRHTNLSFQHCHQDRISLLFPYPNPDSPYPSLRAFSANPSYSEAGIVRTTHPNYAAVQTSPNSTSCAREDTADWRSHDVLQGVAHAYRRKCPACVSEDIKELWRMDRERGRREREARAVERAGCLGRGDASGGGTGNQGLMEPWVPQQQSSLVGGGDDEEAAAGDSRPERESHAITAWQRYAERGLVEAERQAVRSRRRRIMVEMATEQQLDTGAPSREMSRASSSDRDHGEPWSSLPRTASTAVDGHTDRRAADERRRSEEGSRQRVQQSSQQQQSPDTIQPIIDSGRLGPRVRQRQLDLMEQARLYELQIWSQRAADGGLTDRQRELLASRPLLATIPEERMRQVETELRRENSEVHGRGEGVPQTGLGRPRMIGTYGSLRMARSQIDAMNERESWWVPSAGTEAVRLSTTVEASAQSDSRGLRSEGELLPILTYAGHTAVGPSASMENHPNADSAYNDTTVGTAQPHWTEVRPNTNVSFLLDQSHEDMPNIPAWRQPGQNQEAWELISGSTSPMNTSETSEDTGKDDIQPEEYQLNTSVIDNVATVKIKCPNHEPHEWTTVSNQPTHIPLRMHIKESLASQRDSPEHKTMPDSGEAQEDLNDDTWEILVTSEMCGHSLAVTVSRLEYVDASQIRARCGCYGFDRCLVSVRRATSAQECLACRMSKERAMWAQDNGRDAAERCPWFERHVRRVEGNREWALWPFGARDSKPALC